MISQNGLSYSLYSIDENRFYALSHYSFIEKENYISEIDHYFSSENLSHKDFHSISIIYANSKNTIVPEVLFDKTNYESVYRLNFTQNIDEEIKFSSLPKSKNNILFSINKNILELLDKHFNSYKLFPQSHFFIETNFTSNKISDKDENCKMYVQVFDDFIETLVLKDSKILFYNTFNSKTSNDILYYIINVFEQLELSQESTAIIFSGFIDKDNLAIINLKKFVRLVYFESLNSSYKYYYKFLDNIPHYFIHLLSSN